jgi:Na+/H+ antiporter NhaC
MITFSGVELSYIQENFALSGIHEDAYLTFLRTIPYSFYPMSVLIFSLMVILTGRDFGPMLWAEKRAFRTGLLLGEGSRPLADAEGKDMIPKAHKPKRWYNAVVPFVVAIGAIFVGIVVTGTRQIHSDYAYAQEHYEIAVAENNTEDMTLFRGQLDKLSLSPATIFGLANPYVALIWASFSSSAVAMLLVTWQGILTLSEAMDAWLAGCKSMMFALLILIHAWSLGAVCQQLSTAEFIVSQLQGSLNPGLLPALIFLFSALVSFTTGSAWGTMAILFPLVIPLSCQLANNNHTILLGSIASVLSGSVWGNHSSPISDSCIMSSMSSACDHGDHVRTQAVYAIVVGSLSVLVCLVPVGLKWYPWYVGQLITLALLYAILLLFGKKVEESEEEEEKEVLFLRILRKCGVHRFLPHSWMSSMDAYPYSSSCSRYLSRVTSRNSFATSHTSIASTEAGALDAIPIEDELDTTDQLHHALHTHEDEYYREHYERITYPFTKSHTG